tara:strand:- start:84 stop:782 length:699 start_codon:yes stop_codon:yes gene_type:complete
MKLSKIYSYGLLGIFVLLSFYTKGHEIIYDCTDESNDPKAKLILDAVQNRYKEHANISIDFLLIIQFVERPKTEENGRIVQNGEQFKVEMKEQDIYCNGEDLWYHLKSKNEVQINDYEGDEDLGVVSPADLLKQYESGEFEYTLKKEFVSSGRKMAEVEFKPTDSFSDYSKLRVTINKGLNKIVEVLAFGKDGSRFRMVITKESYDQNYSEEFFEFDPIKFPNVFIEDLRLD